MHSHDVANDVFVGEVDEDQSERFTRTQHLAQNTKEVFRTPCFETRVYHVNNFGDFARFPGLQPRYC